MVARSLMVLVVLLSADASAADVQGRARLWLGPAFDSNPSRDFVANSSTNPDGFLFALLQLEGLAHFGERIHLLGSYDVGGRKFMLLPSQDTVVQAAQVEGTVSFLKFFDFGLVARARDRRGAERDYTDLQGGAAVDFVPDAAVDVRLQVSAHRFLFYNRFAYSFWGPDGLLSARYRFDRRHSISAFGSYNPRTYNAKARSASMEETLNTRSDAVFGAGVGYSYRGPIHLTLSYSYFDQTSNSFGESVIRHRLNATAGIRLPWKLSVLGSLTWQPSLFPEGIYLSPDLTVLEDDENVSALSVKVVRPLSGWLDVDLRYAGYWGVLPQNNLQYLRHVVSIGLSASY